MARIRTEHAKGVKDRGRRQIAVRLSEQMFHDLRDRAAWEREGLVELHLMNGPNPVARITDKGRALAKKAMADR